MRCNRIDHISFLTFIVEYGCWLRWFSSVLKSKLTLGDLSQISSLRSSNLSILFEMVDNLRSLVFSIGLKVLCMRKRIATRLVVSSEVRVKSLDSG